MEETFGLGRNALTDIDFLVQFVGTSGEAEVGGGVDAITGATVTSRAVAVASVPPARMSPVQMSARLRQSGEVDAV